MTVKVSAQQSGGRFALTERLLPGGMATPFHAQPEDDELFYVLEGELTYLEDGQPIPASAGSFVHVPAGVAHAFQVDPETARIPDVTTAQHERFFRATSDPARARPPNSPRVHVPFEELSQREFSVMFGAIGTIRSVGRSSLRLKS